MVTLVKIPKLQYLENRIAASPGPWQLALFRYILTYYVLYLDRQYINYELA